MQMVSHCNHGNMHKFWSPLIFLGGLTSLGLEVEIYKIDLVLCMPTCSWLNW